MNSPVLIIGGGLAGLTAAIHLRRKGIEVTVFEKESFPRHKVCGEYISNEVLPYLSSLGLDVFEMGAQRIERMAVSTRSGHTTTADLALGGFGISRYRLDAALYRLARELGAVMIEDKVTDCKYENGEMVVNTQNSGTFRSRIAIGAFGKRSILDKKLERDHLEEDASFLAVKAHYKGSFPEDLVALHNFKGGYCGISRVENNLINVCYIVDFKTFKQHKDIAAFQEVVMQENPNLDEFFVQSTCVFEEPMAISQISFAEKKSVDDHLLMCGDSAGLIHPLCGNGMSMAIHGAKIVSEAILKHGAADEESRKALEEEYTASWSQAFDDRLNRGRQLARLFSSDRLSAGMMIGLRLMPGVLPRIISSTHGTPLEPISE